MIAALESSVPCFLAYSIALITVDMSSVGCLHFILCNAIEYKRQWRRKATEVNWIMPDL